MSGLIWTPRGSALSTDQVQSFGALFHRNGTTDAVRHTDHMLGDDWGIHETTVQRTVERVETALIASEQFRLPGNTALGESGTVYSLPVVDASEVPYERPKKSSAAGTAARQSVTP